MDYLITTRSGELTISLLDSDKNELIRIKQEDQGKIVKHLKEKTELYLKIEGNSRAGSFSITVSNELPERETRAMLRFRSVID